MRYLGPAIKDTFKRKKMVFLGGPRQVGKTTFAKSLLHKESNGYFNYDYIKDKKLITSGDIPTDEPLIVLDEIHKFAKWRNLVKGFHDVHKENFNLMITGSARLDLYRKGGDSLLGRYEYFRLHPFSITEAKCSVDDLMKLSGFPEPLMSGSERIWRKWQIERSHKIIHEDINSLENVKEISLLDLLYDSLPQRVGSPLSLKSLKEDLEVSHDSIKRWVEIFDKMYLTFRISPYGHPKIRAVKLEQKLYFWDWTSCPDTGPRFENLVASHLLKYCHFIEDSEGYKMELRFLRDIDKREIDFVVMKDKKPLFAVECKTGDRNLSPHIAYFKERTPIPAFYQVHMGKTHRGDPKNGGQLIPFERFCKEIGIP
jgi:predicted AAA+ superfamily ATPase